MNQIFCGDARWMGEVADESVQLVVTSPPYNVGKPYDQHDDNLPMGEYLNMLERVFSECWRVLVKGGRLCVNVANVGRTPYIPLSASVTVLLAEQWLHRGEIIWDRGASAGVSTAWGSFGSSRNPVLRDVHEYILVFSKDSFLFENGGPTGATGGEFASWTRSVWRPEQRVPEVQRKVLQKLRYAREKGKDDQWLAEQIARAADVVYQEPGETVWQMQTAGQNGHPAPFPEELPRRLILLYSRPGDVVLDPFMGSGTTAVAAMKEGRQYIGYDVSETYCQQARERIAANVQFTF